MHISVTEVSPGWKPGIFHIIWRWGIESSFLASADKVLVSTEREAQPLFGVSSPPSSKVS